MDQGKFQNSDEFDKMLSDSLRMHAEPANPAFTDKVISRIDKFEEQKLLGKIVLQERLALACSIACVLSLLFAVTFFGKDIAHVLMNSSGALTDWLTNVLSTFQPNWKLILVNESSKVELLEVAPAKRTKSKPPSPEPVL